MPEIYQNNHIIFSDLILVEGTQYQLLTIKYNLAKLEKIFISYSHNDHYLDRPKELATCLLKHMGSKLISICLHLKMPKILNNFIYNNSNYDNFL